MEELIEKISELLPQELCTEEKHSAISMFGKGRYCEDCKKFLW